MVEVDAEDITTAINQETGVISFTPSASTIAGDYVAIISCGDAEPKSVTLHVTAPTVTEIPYSGAGVINISGLNRDVTISLGRSPFFAQGEMNYELETYTENFRITQTRNATFDARSRCYKDKFVFRQLSNTGTTENIPIKFTCGTAELTLAIRPYR